MHVDTPSFADRRLRVILCGLATSVAVACAATAILPARGEDAPAPAPAAAPAAAAPDITLVHFNPLVGDVSGTVIKYRVDAVKGDPATAPTTTSYLLTKTLWAGALNTRLQENVYTTDWPGIALPQENPPVPASSGPLILLSRGHVLSDMPQGIPYTSIVSETAPLELAGKTWQTRHVVVRGELLHQSGTYGFVFEYWFADDVPSGGLLKRVKSQVLPAAQKQSITFTYLGHEIPATPAPYPRDEQKALEYYNFAMTQSWDMADFVAEGVDKNAIESMLEAGDPQLALKHMATFKDDAKLTNQVLNALLAKGDYKAVLDYHQGISTLSMVRGFAGQLASTEPPTATTDAMLDELAARMDTLYKDKKAVGVETNPGNNLVVLATLLLEHGRRAEAEQLTRHLDGPCPALEILLATAAEKAGDGDGVKRHVAALLSVTYPKGWQLINEMTNTWEALGALAGDSPARPALLEVQRRGYAAVTEPSYLALYRQRLAAALSKGTAAEKEEARALIRGMSTPFDAKVLRPIADNLGIDLVVEVFDRTYQAGEPYRFWESNLEFLTALRRAGKQAHYDAMLQELIDRHLTFTNPGETTLKRSPIVEPLITELLENGKLALAIQVATTVKSIDPSWLALNQVANWVVQHGTQADWTLFKAKVPDIFAHYSLQGISRALTDDDHALGLWLCQQRWPDDAKELRLVKFQIAMRQASAGQSEAALASLEAIRLERPFFANESDLVAWIYVKCGKVIEGVEYFESNCVRTGQIKDVPTPQRLLGRPRGLYVADIVAARVIAGYDVRAYETFARGPKNGNTAVHYIAMGLARGHLGP